MEHCMSGLKAPIDAGTRGLFARRTAETRTSLALSPLRRRQTRKTKVVDSTRSPLLEGLEGLAQFLERRKSARFTRASGGDDGGFSARTRSISFARSATVE